MQGFLDKIRTSIIQFMRGRYGTDQLSLGLISVALVLSFVAIWAGLWASVPSFVLLTLVMYRMLSTDIARRKRENDAFLARIRKPASALHRRATMWQNRKTKAYVRCPHCHAQFALPKGKGRLRATCPKCGQKSEHRV